MLFYILVSFMAAMVSVFYIRRYFRKHAQSYAEDAPQRFHHGAIPRLGGAGIFLGWLLGESARVSRRLFGLSCCGHC